MDDEEKLNLTQEEIYFLKEQVADQKAFKRTRERVQKYVIWLTALIGSYALLGERLPELIKKWLE